MTNKETQRFVVTPKFKIKLGELVELLYETA